MKAAYQVCRICRSLRRHHVQNSSLGLKHACELYLFLCLRWILRARGDSAMNISSCHFDCELDCLKVGIAKSKWNYRDFSVCYHVFANPLMPQICPVISLAIHIVIDHSILVGDRKN